MWNGTAAILKPSPAISIAAPISASTSSYAPLPSATETSSKRSEPVAP